jgi:hypothetical protein
MTADEKKRMFSLVRAIESLYSETIGKLTAAYVRTRLTAISRFVASSLLAITECWLEQGAAE